MTQKIQVAIAVVVALSILAIFIYPLTIGPPAPQQNKSPLAALLGLALAVCTVLFAPRLSYSALPAIFGGEPHSHCDRLALICTRLC